MHCVPLQCALAAVSRRPCHLAALPLTQVGQRTVNESFFSDRSPTVTLKQSVAIVTILKQLGVVDKNGNLMGDPRIDAWVRQWARGNGQESAHMAAPGGNREEGC